MTIKSLCIKDKYDDSNTFLVKFISVDPLKTSNCYNPWCPSIYFVIQCSQDYSFLFKSLKIKRQEVVKTAHKKKNM